MDSEPPTEGQSEGQESRRAYPPAEVQARLEVSASGLRRLAGIYERTLGPLPRDERGRVWPEDAVEALEDARASVRESRAVSIEAALRGQEIAGKAGVPHSATQRGSVDEISPGAAILEELRALRMLVEEQNRRISDLEKAVRTGRELESAPPSAELPGGVSEEGTAPVPGLGPPPVAPDVLGKIPPADEGAEAAPAPVEATEPEAHERSFWRRVGDWFGFGQPRS